MQGKKTLLTKPKTSDSLGKIFTTCHREKTNFLNIEKNAQKKNKKIDV